MQIGQFRALGLMALCAGFAAAALAAQALKGDPARGKTLAAEACASCHGPDGNSEVPAFPKLAGQQEPYLLQELADYKSGARANEIMTPLVAGLSEQDMADLAAFFAKQSPGDGVVANPALLALGKRVYLQGNDKSGVPSCDGCHEENGEGSKRFPRVAGQHADYTLEQMKQYATGKRTNGKKVMRTVAERLTEEETKAVVEYMASLK